MKNLKNVNDRFSEMGRAAMLPGMNYALDILQQAIDEMRGALSEVQQAQKPRSPQAAYWARMTPEERAAEMKRRGMVNRARQSKETKSKASKSVSSFWAQMTPEERSIEMKRRQRVARRNKQAAAKAGSVRAMLNQEAVA